MNKKKKSPMAIIKNWMAYTREAAVKAVSDSRATDKNAIHDVIQRLDEQRQHQRYRHSVQQGGMGISASLFFGFIDPPFSGKQKSVKSLRGSFPSGFHAL